ncbi:hypothetical protein JYG23_05535 [Sedimentibacter sp. zth1]|uniref:GPP34 family phosphoprotein n=1 Tax=Sedimentibacter sp. zth1 TaxID=2816908 RepID=UPI001A93271A|nr:hypothetical protein [Sedimentibacter sp. zth1]QSX06908.1 hypothetical protein JYG23_05535 [Sedimentibacter sp. zth1]
MDIAITNQFLLLSINKERNPDSLFNQATIVALMSLGLYELEKNKVIEVLNGDGDKSDLAFSIIKPLPDNLKYLSIIYQVLLDSKKKTVAEVTSMFFLNFKKQYFDNFSKNLISDLVNEGVLQEYKKAGMFGIEKSKFKVNQASVEEIISKIKSNVFEEKVKDYDMIILARLLDKTDLIYQYFPNKECKIIKEKVTNAMENSDNIVVLRTLKTIDNLFCIILAIITTVIL